MQAETESTDTEENSEAEGEAEEANPEIEEGYTTELDGCTKVVSWCKNGDNNIYGQFYYPADFDENQTYPVVIMSHGIGSTSQMMERAKWPEKAAQDGYVVYTFDFCGGSQNGNSDMDFCMEKYVGCTGTSYGDPNTGGWGYTMCQRCFDYCVAQGVWSCPRPI